MRVFETFKPKSRLLQKYISYFYIDMATNHDYFNEFICYPHFNNTVSFYPDHVFKRTLNHSQVSHQKDAGLLQIFTPIREKQLKVTHSGPLFKIAIVFHAFGLHQFVPSSFKFNLVQASPDFQLITNEVLTELFRLNDPATIIASLEKELLHLFKPLTQPYLEKALTLFHEEESDISIDELAERKLGISRKQLTRIFKSYLGISPQKYRSIVRFRLLMRYKLNEHQPTKLSHLSHQVHYTDQSHFIKACKQLTGLTPSQFFKDGTVMGNEDTFWKFIG